MSTANHSFREHPSTYVVQDRSNQQEITCLQLQDQMLTAGMGGVLPEQPRPASFQRILDVGCGTGDWLIQTARTYPTIETLVGVDVSSTLLAYAQAQAAWQRNPRICRHDHLGVRSWYARLTRGRLALHRHQERHDLLP